MAAALIASGEAKLAARATNRALECWNRVLAFAPNHEAVNAAMRRFEGRHRRKIVAATAAGALVVGLGAWATARLVARVGPDVPPATASAGGPGPGAASPRTDARARSGAAALKRAPCCRRPGPAPRRRADETGARPAGADSADSPKTEAHAAKGDRARHVLAVAHRDKDDRPSAARGDPRTPPPATWRAARPTKRHPAPNPNVPRPTERLAAAGSGPSGPTSRTFALGPTPQNVDVYLDGVRQFAYDMDHRSLEVPWDRTHVIEFRSPSGCCFVARVEVGPDRTLPVENIIARILKWKPARLVVTATPSVPGTRILVRDPARPGRGIVVAPGEEANIPFVATDDGQKDVEVEVDSAHGFATGHATVRAGQRSSLTLKLGNAGTTP